MNSIKAYMNKHDKAHIYLSPEQKVLYTRYRSLGLSHIDAVRKALK